VRRSGNSPCGRFVHVPKTVFSERVPRRRCVCHCSRLNAQGEAYISLSSVFAGCRKQVLQLAAKNQDRYQQFC
jgi:hypothetical protein